MAKPLRVLIALAEVLGLSLVLTSGSCVIPVPGDLMPSGVCRHLHTLSAHT